MEEMHINWYPGHMKKTRELIENNMSIVDVVVEVVDSRIPKSSKNPDIEKIAGSKPIVILLNKEDLSDDRETKKWIDYYKKQNHSVISYNGTTGDGTKELLQEIKESFAPKLERLQNRGQVTCPSPTPDDSSTRAPVASAGAVGSSHAGAAA